MRPYACRLLVAALFVLPAVSDLNAASDVSARPEVPCQIGSYRMTDGSVIDIGLGEPGELRWRLIDGRTGALKPIGYENWSSTYGWTGRADGHRIVISDCGQGGIQFDRLTGRREALRELNTVFTSNGVELAGRLTLPPGTGSVPIVVLVHGAEHDSALLNYSLQRQLASAGIGVFAYDKRGTGASSGTYTQDYLLLAVDAVSAVREARRLAGARVSRVGYQAGSQGGWVAPLAALIEPVDFVIVSFGLAVSPIEEDQEAIEFDLRRAGFGTRGLEGANKLADAAARIVESDFREGFEEFDALKTAYRNEPWFSSVRGNYTGFMLSASDEVLREQAPRLLKGIPLRYDPMPVLRNLAVPQLWLLGGEDRDAPPAETLRRLESLRQGGRPIKVIVYPDADHGLYRFETTAEGKRVYTRQPPTYFSEMRDFIMEE